MKPFPENIPLARVLSEIRSGGAPPLGPGWPGADAARAELGRLSDEELLGGRVLDGDAARAVRAGLLLLASDLTASHGLSQEIDTVNGSYWHGILHRREPDYGNAKYWFRRVGDHPVFEELRAAAERRGGGALEPLRNGRWDPFRMVDLVEACLEGRRRELEPHLVALQEEEMLLLLEHCFRRALGKE